MSFAFIECAFLFSAFLDFSTREKISGHSLVFISTHTYCSDAGRIFLKRARILSHGFDLETVAHACVALLFSVEQKLQSGSRLSETAHFASCVFDHIASLVVSIVVDGRPSGRLARRTHAYCFKPSSASDSSQSRFALAGSSA